ncbi:ribosomal large subunit pseudouridine synthase C [Buchnera aphidicola (Cinara tujafilina)]|uniref:Pseudouridine synthase n=1 Tax=Buchnera aphidicola (Cinara tujafilina) TaxID=261317 RepID=F7WZE6_9GAMM|nr:RluA family pseudouridine synthase [Buchnera aphidicola]AEH39808.1 ribosomal large subunit pseudouridine synthase C [Buchnera aphidicola (Cinara tujafilina)]
MNRKIVPKYKIIVKKNVCFQRIDNFLFKTFKKLPKSMIYRCLRIGKIRLNHKKIKPTYKLKKNDIITVFAINVALIKKKILKLKQSTINFFLKHIIYEDDHLLIINKPTGISVHSGSGINFGIIEIFREIRPDIFFLELVHRLDKDTSGVLMLAKKKSILKKLHQQLRDKEIYKEYKAIVYGHWPKNNIVDLPLLRIKNLNNKNKVCIHNNGKSSQTNFIVQKYYPNTTLLSVIPITGRTHQIRVHASYSGHPILFDNRYGTKEIKKTEKIYKKNNMRLLLHAQTVIFIHPKNQKKICIYAPLCKNFKKYVHFFSKNIHN